MYNKVTNVSMIINKKVLTNIVSVFIRTDDGYVGSM